MRLLYVFGFSWMTGELFEYKPAETVEGSRRKATAAAALKGAAYTIVMQYSKKMLNMVPATLRRVTPWVE
jgi:hypothetical protein